MSAKTLVESPSGLVHLAHVITAERLVTFCGRDVDNETWSRIRLYDLAIFGKGRSTIARMVELPEVRSLLQVAPPH